MFLDIMFLYMEDFKEFIKILELSIYQVYRILIKFMFYYYILVIDSLKIKFRGYFYLKLKYIEIENGINWYLCLRIWKTIYFIVLKVNVL